MKSKHELKNKREKNKCNDPSGFSNASQFMIQFQMIVIVVFFSSSVHAYTFLNFKSMQQQYWRIKLNSMAWKEMVCGYIKVKLRQFTVTFRIGERRRRKEKKILSLCHIFIFSTEKRKSNRLFMRSCLKKIDFWLRWNDQ